MLYPLYRDKYMCWHDTVLCGLLRDGDCSSFFFFPLHQALCDFCALICSSPAIQGTGVG